MTNAPPAADYRPTIFLPKTDFPMKAGLAETEPRLLARWLAEGSHAALRTAREGAPRWILHDGPPYANGDMHLGHAMNHILKDFVVRTRSMLGYDSPYIPGWDCHGLPIEWRVEELNREKGIKKGEMDFIAFRQQCRDYARHWVGVQREQLKRLGIWGDWENPYLTMDFASEAVIAQELMKFAESGQLYRGAKPVMWSPVEQTALAEAEVEYEDITSTQVDVAFEITHAPNAPELEGAYAVIWTTTPWTLPVNRALAFAPDKYYSILTLHPAKTSDHRWFASSPTINVLIAEDCLHAFKARIHPDNHGGFGFFPGITGERFRGSVLHGAIARHPLHALGGFFAEPRPLLPGDFVTTDQGTGLVHMAPDHGEDDFVLCKAHGIDPKFVVGPDGRYQDDWPVVGGLHVYNVNGRPGAKNDVVCSALGEALLSHDDYKHSYPHSWRSKAKLIYRCTPQWFIAMDRDLGDATTLRSRALNAISETRWFPAQGENRIRAMVEGRPDWVLSRQRAWGVPVTVFVKKGSAVTLKDPEVNARIASAIAQDGADAWWTRDPQSFLGDAYSAADYEKVTDILDVWFDSGSTHAFVTEARLHAEQADLYLEGSDQHRGWFQSSLLESCGTRGQAPYKGVLTHGMTLDDKGRKMSKSVGNVVDPQSIIKDSGVDVLRLWVGMTDTSEDQRFGKLAMQTTVDAYRKLRNTIRYLLGALEGFTPAEAVPHAEMPELERFILSRLAALDAELRTHLEAHAYNRYTAAILHFVNQDLSAFFFDVRKDSLYCDHHSSPKRRACRTVLATLFDAITRWLAPILVFTAEEAHEQRHGAQASSIHQQTYAEIEPGWRNEALDARYTRLRELRALATQSIEPMRRDKLVGSSSQIALSIGLTSEAELALVRSVDFAELCLVSDVRATAMPETSIQPSVSPHPRCERCWRHLPDVAAETGLCTRCSEAIA